MRPESSMATTLSIEVEPSTFRVLSIEDDPDAVSGTLTSLELEGIRVERAPTVAEARALLEGRGFGLLIVDQQLEGDDEAGTNLLRALHDGELGELNRSTPFIFVTGSREWVTAAAVDVSEFTGYRDVIVKGKALTPTMLAILDELGARPARDVAGGAELWNVPMLVESVLEVGTLVRIPARDTQEPIFLAWSSWPPEIACDATYVADGRWLIASVNIFEEDDDRLIVRNVELAPAERDDDGLA